MDSKSVLVVGAGPTGMAMAIELRRAGLEVRVIDKSDHAALHSQALVVQSRTLEQFQRYGIAGEAIDRGRKITKAELWSEGKNIVSFELQNIPSRYPYALFLAQKETESILGRYLESLGVRIERQTELVSFMQEGDSVLSNLRHADGSEEEFGCRWLVGCDGAHSLVRKLTQIPFEGHGIELSFYLGDFEIEGPDAPTEQLVVHLHHGDVVFMARLTDKLTRLIVALHSEQGRDSRRELSVKDFQDAVDLCGVRITVKSAEWMTPFNVNDLQALHYRAGNVFLAGDASHIHSPVAGQGMNTGIQDVANLGWKMAAVARGADAGLLDSYETERGAVGRALLRVTERALRMVSSSSAVVQEVRDFLLPIVTKSKAVQHMLTGFVSETSIAYRDSPVVFDHGGDGDLRAGDRMPDLGLSGGSTLLGDWTDSQHLAILVGVGETDFPISGVRVVKVGSSDLDDEGKRALGTEPKVLVVRSDGYVGFRGPVAKLAELEAYARQDGLGERVYTA